MRTTRRIFESEYKRKLRLEKGAYSDCTQVHDLPDIFHYWSNRYLLPKHLQFGIKDPEHLFFLYAKRQCQRDPTSRTQLISIGAGNCDMEVRLAKSLLDDSISNFDIECLDINDSMLERGRALAEELGVADHVRTHKADFNKWVPRCGNHYDVIIANQCLHHVLELEHLFSSIRHGMKESGRFLISDTIGRNGHQRWPEALEGLKPFWEELPTGYRYNHQLKRHEPEYVNRDWSASGFEGIRAQDILPLLVGHFHFELFIPFANIIMAFIDRPFGPNFDPQAEWDRDFIDRVHERDEDAILRGEWTPTLMLGVLRKTPVETTQLAHPTLTPQFCVRKPRGED